MLKFQLEEVTDVPPSYKCSVRVEFRKETTAQTSLREPRGTTCDFADVEFFLVLQRTDSMVFTAICASDDGNYFEATYELSGQVFADVNWMDGVVVRRRFPLTMPQTSKRAPMFLKLKANYVGDAGLDRSRDAKVDVTEQSGRYKKLLASLDAEGLERPTTESNTMGSWSLGLSFVGANEGGGSAELSRKGFGRVTAPRKALPGAPSGGIELSHLRHLIYEGHDNATVVSIGTVVGKAVMPGSEMMSVLRNDQGEEPGRNQDQEQLGYSEMYAQADAYRAGPYAQLQAQAQPLLSPTPASAPTGQAEVICWTVKEPGIVSKVCVQVGSSVKPGDVLAIVDCSLVKQQLSHLAAADEIAVNIPGSCKLNDRFQKAAERLVSSMSSSSESSELLGCCSDLERVVRDFMETVRTYGRLIISEINSEQKTVRPLQMGGVLGGAKYVVKGVLFKIPDGQLFHNYPDPMHIANKVQGHELKGLKAYFGWFFNKGSVGLVNFPLTALIDYKGWRITAMTLLPIRGSKTLIYGSGDAGSDCNVRNDVPEWSALIREASLGLNLKSHRVVNGRAAQGEAEIASCVDLEGHKGTDGRFYLLDFSRTFPPAFKKPIDPSRDNLWPFYNMMRAEFVKRWESQLSSDAFSTFQSMFSAQSKEEAKHNQQNVRQATEAIESKVVEAVCHALFATHDASISIRHVFHREGLNMRYLGLVYQKLVGELYQASKHNLYLLVQIEAVVRVFKGHVRQSLRNAQRQTVETSETSLLECLSHIMNDLFGASDTESWTRTNDFCQTGLVQNFGFKLSHAVMAVEAFVEGTRNVVETMTSGEMVEVTFKYAVLRRLNDVLGLGLSATLLGELRKCNGFKVRSFSQTTVFVDSDFSFEERVKHLDIVERARGLSEYLQGQNLRSKTAPEHLMKAFDIFEGALEASPMDPWLSLLMGNICFKLYSLLPSTENNTKELFADRTVFFYRRAFAFESHPLAFLQLGRFLAKRGQYDEAESYLLKALEERRGAQSSFVKEALKDLVVLLEKKGAVEMASKVRHETSGFVQYPESWTSAKTAGKLDSSAGDISKVSMGRNRRKVSVSASPSGLLDSSIRKIASVHRVLKKKVEGTLQMRKSPRAMPSFLEGRNSGTEDSLVESGSGRSSFVEDPDSGRSLIEDDEDEEMGADLAAAMERNQKLLDAASSGTDAKEDEVVAIDRDMQDYLQMLMKRQGTRTVTGGSERYSTK